MTTWYVSKDFFGYRILDENGDRIGRLYRTRRYWTYEAANGSKRRLVQSLEKSLRMININVKWMEQLTHFEEVK